ncbi:E3 SUMO-protein ligase ZBED1-like isoform X2 [Haematobia irritans]|uniref:E3 SUMO-protein ligase ZBED1-like isoform X2 n=1 Tax=Haematobia irritans TaxID=7368 RepID=UPI003F5023E9
MEQYLQKSNDTRGENIENSDSSASDNERVVKRRSRKGTSEVWEYFEKMRDKKHAKCRSCGKVYKTSGNTSNLFDHLKRSHPTYRTMPKQLTRIDTFFKKSGTYDSNSERKNALDNALMTMIAIDMQPFSIVEDQGFRELIKCLDPRYSLPSRTTLQKVMMVDKYNNIKTSLQQILNDVEQCAITMDCWTSRANEGYLTVTCHFTSKNFDLRTAVLSTKKLLVATNHTAENISNSLSAVLQEWKLMDKVVSIVTDNDSSMIKACELLQKRNLPCFAHTVNLVVQDCLSQDYIKPILAKCKKIVTYFKSSTISYEKFKADQDKDKPYSLIQEVPTRWNSALKMVERILLTNSSISKTLLATPKAPPPLTADDIEILQDLKELLSPFDNATVQTSSSSNVTISLIIPLICGIFQNLNENRNKMKTSEGTKACEFLTQRVQKRLFPYEERTVARLGTLLDPRFKKEGFRCISNADKGTHFLQNEISVMVKTNSNETETAEPSTSKNMSPESQQPLLTFVQNKIANKVRTSHVDAIISVRQYMENENIPIANDPLKYWTVKSWYWNVGNKILCFKVFLHTSDIHRVGEDVQQSWIDSFRSKNIFKTKTCKHVTFY